MSAKVVQAHEAYHRIGLPVDLRTAGAAPDTTVVVLNWSRFPNVKRIASLLCSPILDSVIAEVFVWNNSPNKITHDDFRDAGCPAEKLRIYNSPENVYFQARFLACELVTTPYCFIQDDDYLIVPEVLHTLHAAITRPGVPRTIHLLPAHEHLSTSLRELHAPTGPHSALAAIHTGFAWLGHGAMLHRSEAVEFLALMRALYTSEPEMKMADNYYTILGNRVPEVWFDQGIELGGGQPFTVGTEGDERNNRHIVRATEYLDKIAAGELTTPGRTRLPYVSYDARGFDTSVVRAACRETRCLLETNIALLPEGVRRESESVRRILELEAINRDTLAAGDAERYITHPPSRAVDDRLDTYFLSPQGAKAGDYISLDFFEDVHVLHPWTTIELICIVDNDSERILETCVLETSLDGVEWFSVRFGFRRDTVQDTAKDGDEELSSTLCECVWRISGAEEEAMRGQRCFRLRNTADHNPPWKIHKLYLRGVLQGSVLAN